MQCDMIGIFNAIINNIMTELQSELSLSTELIHTEQNSVQNKCVHIL